MLQGQQVTRPVHCRLISACCFQEMLHPAECTISRCVASGFASAFLFGSSGNLGDFIRCLITHLALALLKRLKISGNPMRSCPTHWVRDQRMLVLDCKRGSVHLARKSLVWQIVGRSFLHLFHSVDGSPLKSMFDAGMICLHLINC